MKPNDAALRDALVNVLNTFGVEFEDVNRNGSPTLSFTLGHLTQRFSYNSSTEDSNGSVRKLVNTLVQAGLKPKPPEPARPRRVREVRQPAFAEAVDEHYSDQPDLPIDHNALNPELEVLEREEFIAEASTRNEPNMDQPMIDDFQVEVSETVNQTRETGFTVYRPRPDYTPADVLVFEASQDYLITKGEKIIIPVHRPDLMMHLAAEEFARRYMPYKFERPYAIREPDPPRQTRQPSKTNQPIPRADVTLQSVYEQPDPVDALDPSTVYVPRPPQMPEPKIKIPRKPPLDEAEEAFLAGVKPVDVVMRPDEPVELEKPLQPPSKRLYTVNKSGGRIKVGGVNMPAQLGRILAGIRQASLESEKDAVTANEAKNYMPPNDRKQIAARIPPAVEAGWIVIKKATGQGTGYLYSVTESGHRVIVPAAKQCYIASGLEIPPFIEEIS